MTPDDEWNKALATLKQIEGGYANDPDDPGGETNWGITIKVARAYGYRGEMADMPYETAALIYRERYWDAINLDRVCMLSERVAHEIFDTGVNTGVGRAARFLQEWLNALNRNEQDYDDLVVDHLIGRMTLNALQAYLNKRGDEGERVLLNGLNASQAIHYKDIDMEKYLYGWMSHRVNIE